MMKLDNWIRRDFHPERVRDLSGELKGMASLILETMENMKTKLQRSKSWRKIFLDKKQALQMSHNLTSLLQLLIPS